MIATDGTYPNADIARAARHEDATYALISGVEIDSPAYDAGFEPGCAIVSVDGNPVRDIIDWRWLTDGDEIEVGYIDTLGDSGSVVLVREEGESWGFEFEGLVFDGVKQCRNACTFCFMHQLPKGLRPSLSLRDDDFRLSFLVGTFVTLTNLSEKDERRIVDQHISPLRVSLQASEADVRARLIGRHAAHGIAAFDRLLEAGIEARTQIVLVPGENDAEVLAQTLEWAYARPGILDVGIVPLGYTKHQKRFCRSFNEADEARSVLDAIAPIQARAQAERGCAWVYAADEFYCNAYGDEVLAHLPSADFYDGYELFEDGIGIVRSVVDEWRKALADGVIERAGKAAQAAEAQVRFVAGYALQHVMEALIGESGIAPWFKALYVENDFFGGNVDVTGLLVGGDIACALKADDTPGALYVVPRVVLNDDGVFLDDATVEDVEKAAGKKLAVVSCSPYEYFEDIEALLHERAHAS